MCRLSGERSFQQRVYLAAKGIRETLHQQGKRPVGRGEQRHVEKALRLEWPEDKAVLVAAQMCRTGTPPLALVETQTFADRQASLQHLSGALRGWRLLAKGLRLIAEIRKAGVPRYTGASAIAVEGKRQAETITFTSGGRSHRLECATVLLPSLGVT
ncbi:hypothetical protein [Roseibium aggregatum]|uniref:hypothetical protein n=1 Tax=Roseibium aggregatum TaxID=187304 RepID=UPI0025AD9C76|nr:hypothetical protein [Roseibium aggregatum]WJS02182.1 hypothetical protein QUB73_23910 [Roseibium aggregatum]